MPQNCKISQRRFLFDQIRSQGFRSMPSTDSGLPEKMDAMPPEQVVGIARNGWTASIGIDGRHGPDYAPTSTIYPNVVYFPQ